MQMNINQYFAFDEQNESPLFISDFQTAPYNPLKNPSKFEFFSMEDQFWNINDANKPTYQPAYQKSKLSEENQTSDGGSTSMEQKFMISNMQMKQAKLLSIMTQDEKKLIQQCLQHLAPLEKKFQIKLMNLEMFDDNEIHNIKGKAQLFPYSKSPRKIGFHVEKKLINKNIIHFFSKKLGRKAKKSQLRESEKLKNNRKFFLQKLLRCMTSIPEFQKLIQEFCREEELSEQELFNYFSDARIKEIGSLQSIQNLWDNSLPAKRIFVKFCKFVKINELELRIVLHSKVTNKRAYLQSVQKLFACINKPWLLQPQKATS